MSNPKEQEEFIGLIEEYQDIIHKICNVYCNNKEEKKDLFQEVVYQLWRSYGSFENRSKFTTWMYRVALNVALAGKRKPQPPTRELDQTSLKHLADEDKTTETEENIRLLYQAINQLNDFDKAVIMLYLERKPYEEIAEITGITTSNVGTRINRIKAKLEKILKPVIA